MNDRAMQFRVGVMVLAALLITAILWVMVEGTLPWIGPATYTLYIDFTKAPGVAVDTPVRKNGVRIGEVTNVELRDTGVLVTVAIKEEVNGAPVRIRENEVCQITGSILGDKALEFVLRGDARTDAAVLKPGSLVPGRVSVDPLEVIGNLEGSLSEAIGAVADTSNQIGELALTVRELIVNNEEQFGRVVTKAELALDELRVTVENANDLVGDADVRKGVREALADFPELLDKLHETIDGFKGTMEAVDRNLRNIEGLTGPLGERGEHLVANIESATARLDDVLGRMDEFTERIADPDSPVGMLLNDPETAFKIVDIIDNVHDLTRDMRPILDDVRTFTNKLARDPSRIGVGGLIRRPSGTK